MSPESSMAGLEKAHRRLEDLYEISKLFASFESLEQTFAPVLGLVTRTLPLCSAILMEAQGEDKVSRMNIWPAEAHDSEMRAVKQHAETAYAYLVGVGSTESLGRGDIAGNLATRFIVIPLVVAHQRPFGVLQLEGAQPLDKTDLLFVNAVVNQLAIALDRDRAWRHDITRREQAEKSQTHAEQKQTDAEARGATVERDLIIAESSSDKYEALASDNARLYQQAQQAVRVREQILAIVSHDLKNPLATILMTAETLAKRGTVPQAVGRIQRSAERMLRLIEDLLDFASIEVGSLPIRRHPQDPASIIQETLASFDGQVQEKGLRLTGDIGPRLPRAYCDRDRILQVLSNLVGNATKATPKGGHITLRVESQGPELLFTVSDDGPGISEDDVKHLFERYWRSGEAEYRGTGLGLAISRGIVNAHGGRLSVNSVLGLGATFLFTVPAADETALFIDPATETPTDPAHRE